LGTVSVVIATKNRKKELRRALKSCLEQDIKLDLIVLDDGSDDGTSDMVKMEFPNVILVSDGESRRQMFRRNQGVEISKSKYVVFIDDDCVFTKGDIVSKNLEKFNQPWVGGVSIPFINVKINEIIHQKAPDEFLNYTLSGVGEGAYIVRRDVYLKCGGFNVLYQREQEGEELAIRMLDAGYIIRAGFSEPLHHIHSFVRDDKLSHIFGPRNLILFAWFCVPGRYLLPQLLGSTVNAIRHGFRIGKPILKGLGLLKGYFACVQYSKVRNPVSVQAYKAYRYLRASGIAQDEEILSMLPNCKLDNGSR
jgi:glycosyltransferase involved in cell wall biosynthesis